MARLGRQTQNFTHPPNARHKPNSRCHGNRLAHFTHYVYISITQLALTLSHWTHNKLPTVTTRATHHKLIYICASFSVTKLYAATSYPQQPAHSIYKYNTYSTTLTRTQLHGNIRFTSKLIRRKEKSCNCMPMLCVHTKQYTHNTPSVLHHSTHYTIKSVGPQCSPLSNFWVCEYAELSMTLLIHQYSSAHGKI